MDRRRGAPCCASSPLACGPPTGANEHVSFGGGSHFCLGNALARLETQSALPKLVRRFPRMEPAYSEPAWLRRITLRGVETLPVVLR